VDIVQLSVTHNKLLVDVFLATEFGSEIEPSSGHRTRIVTNINSVNH